MEGTEFTGGGADEGIIQGSCPIILKLTYLKLAPLFVFCCSVMVQSHIENTNVTNPLKKEVIAKLLLLKSSIFNLFSDSSFEKHVAQPSIVHI